MKQFTANLTCCSDDEAIKSHNSCFENQNKWEDKIYVYVLFPLKCLAKMNLSW